MIVSVVFWVWLWWAIENRVHVDLEQFLGFVHHVIWRVITDLSLLAIVVHMNRDG